MIHLCLDPIILYNKAVQEVVVAAVAMAISVRRLAIMAVRTFVAVDTVAETFMAADIAVDAVDVGAGDLFTCLFDLLCSKFPFPLAPFSSPLPSLYPYPFLLSALHVLFHVVK